MLETDFLSWLYFNCVEALHCGSSPLPHHYAFLPTVDKVSCLHSFMDICYHLSSYISSLTGVVKHIIIALMSLS